MERNASQNLPWLVKASGRLIGPYTRDEVIAKLKSKEFVLLDEVAQPLQRWRYVRDEPQFASVVEELRRGAYAGREDTMTTSVSAGTRSLTEEIDPRFDEFSRTEELGPDHILDAEFTEKIDQTRVQPNGDLRAYGLGADARVQERIGRSTRYVWPFTMVLIASLAGIFYWTHRQTHVEEKPKNFDELIQKGVDGKRVGDLRVASENLKKAQALKPDDPDVNLLLAPILISAEGQTVEGKRLLQKVLPVAFNPLQICEAKTAIGLASLMDGNLDEANQALSDALVAQKSFYPALANMGALYYIRGNYPSAREYFASATEANPHDASLIVLQNRAELDAIDKKQNKGGPSLRQIEDSLRAALDTYDFRAEAYLLMAYTQLLAKTDDNAVLSIDTMLDLDPKLTENHVHELLVYRKPIGWESLLPICEKIYSTYNHSPHMRALQALCLFKANNRVDAKKVFDDAILQAPKDNLVRALYSAILLEMGQDKEAAATLGDVAEDTPYELPFIMQARLCELKNDFTCSEQKWQHLMEKNSRSIEAVAGLGRMALAKKDFKKAREMADQGLQMSPTYAPLIKVQDAANREK